MFVGMYVDAERKKCCVSSGGAPKKVAATAAGSGELGRDGAEEEGLEGAGVPQGTDY